MKNNHQFGGFPKEGLHFLNDLKYNNHPQWFHAHKADYTDYLLKPAQQFVEAFGQLLRKNISRKIVADARPTGGSIFRIYRDIRFSKDKTPYKTHVGILFWEDRQGKKLNSPGIYFHLEDQGAQLHVGQFEFPKTRLDHYRKMVAHPKWGPALEKIISELTNNNKYIINGEHFKNVPRDYPPDHPRAALLKYNGLYASSPWLSSVILTQSKLPEVCLSHCLHMAPLFEWLMKVKI